MFGGKRLVEIQEVGGRISEKKMQITQMPSHNETMEEVSFKLNNRKVFTIRGEIGDGLTGKIDRLMWSEV